MQPLTMADLNRHIARKMTQDLAAAAHTAPIPPTHTSTPRMPRHGKQQPARIAVQPAAAQTEVEDASFMAGYRAGWRWGLIDGILLGSFTTAALAGFGYLIWAV